MILKYFELNKINLKLSNFFLLYGKNEGLKKNTLNYIINKNAGVSAYDEKDILENQNIFIENILSRSLFEKEKIIIIKRSTDKILNLLNELDQRNLEETVIIIIADNLEKKSKLRSFFEKNKKHICIAFYPDNAQTLSKITYDFIREKNISISSANINLIVDKCNGDRESLLNELEKIEYFSKNGKKVNFQNITKLTNLAENHSVSELIDNCLAKNKKKTLNILNENNFSNDDCILITRTFLNKSKKILKLISEFEINRNIDLTIFSAKPPIFWKDKEIIKQQLNKWTSKSIKDLIFKLNDVELLIKKNFNNSINVITNFILEQSSSETNN
jgi:DNA polymerase III subunit delta